MEIALPTLDKTIAVAYLARGGATKTGCHYANDSCSHTIVTLLE